MKKIYALIIVLIVIIVVMGVSFFVYVKNNKNGNSISQGSISENENTQNADSEKVQGSVPENSEDSFKGYTIDQWQQMIRKFYESYKRTDLKDIICEYDENNNFTATLTTQFEVCAELVFDNETGYATEKYTKLTIDFINGKFITKLKNEDSVFSDNTCVAIGYVEGQNDQEFINKYFESENVFYSITKYDFRDELERQSQYDNMFVFIPKNEKVKISLYDCYINNNGELVKTNKLIDNASEAFVLLEKVAESTTPSYIVEYSYNGFKDEFPLVFSGADGKLDLTGNESEVKDISIYNYFYEY